jgi:hypothetical protein
MGLSKTIWTNPTEFLRLEQPENPVLFFAPSAVQAAARRFIDGFPGMVTYAVKSNPGEEMIENLAAAGIRGYDCASPFEIDLIRRLAPDAAIHYNNPVRVAHGNRHAVDRGVKSYSVDSRRELQQADRDGPGRGHRDLACASSCRWRVRPITSAPSSAPRSIWRPNCCEDGGGGGLRALDHLPPRHAMHRPACLGGLYPRGGRDRPCGRRDHRAAERRRRLPQPPAERVVPQLRRPSS